MYGCIVGVADERQDLIPGFVAWIDVSGNILFEGLVEAFGEAICLKDQSFMWTEGHLDLAEVGDRKAIGKRASNWPRKINRSCGLRATWTWLRWGT